MKYLVLLCDGMADLPLPEYENKTPMELAKKPNMDALAKNAYVGLAKTVPEGMKPGSDVANLAAMGYFPADYYTGRSPLEAASIGVDLKDKEYAIRCNFVTLSDEENYADKTMVDYCAGDISTKEAEELVAFLNPHLPKGMKLYPGVSYRHCLTWENENDDLGYLTQPHDISDQKITNYLPDPEKAALIKDVMIRSYDLLKDHPVNQKRIAEGKRPANSMWLWGQGRRAKLDNFKEKTGLNGAVISAVDLIKGIGILAGMDVIEVEGATAYIDTNFEGKANAAIQALSDHDFVYLHIEAPDECGHRGETENKIRSIEIIDEKVLGPVKKALDEMGDYRIMILPDHPTPLSIKTHTADPVPFLIYDSQKSQSGVDVFCEKEAKETGVYYPVGADLLSVLIKK